MERGRRPAELREESQFQSEDLEAELAGDVVGKEKRRLGRKHLSEAAELVPATGFGSDAVHDRSERRAPH
jgi:hypothetical protein